MRIIFIKQKLSRMQTAAGILFFKKGYTHAYFKKNLLPYISDGI